MKKPRNLFENEICVKVDKVTEHTVTLILYVKPPVVKNIMDETFGNDNWMSELSAIPKQFGGVTMISKVSVWDEERERWISRSDCGEPIANGSDKSQATDALKRSCALFGVAAELKTLPKPIICDVKKPACDANGNKLKLNGFQQQDTYINVTVENDGSYSCHDSFSITQYKLDEKGNIAALCIKNNTTGKIIFKEIFDEKSASYKGNSITPLSSPEIARLKLLKADCGPMATQGKKLSELDTEELIWLFGATKNNDIKRAILEISKADERLFKTFIGLDINPDTLLKTYR